MINPKYLIYHDLIGFQAYAKLKSKINKKDFLDIGIVIDETRDMLISERDGHIKKFVKKDYIFRFKLQAENEEESMLEVQGQKIVGLPVNRLRSLKKRRWSKR
ncbi:MAG: ribonuclease P protein subunit [Promethearchaeota archaeon]